MEQPKPESRFVYDEWMKNEGIPVFETLGGVDDAAELPRRPWARMGGLGTFILMRGTFEAERGLYVVEIPGGGALEPERHLYEESLYVLKGRGLTEIWQEGGAKQTFEWREGSLFAPPLNAWHRLVNGSREPALLLGVTTTPNVMEALGDPEFIFNCDHLFAGRWGGDASYFTPGEERYLRGWTTLWRTNFIPDSGAALLDDLEQKVAGGQLTGFRMAGGFPAGHISEWPAGRYHKAHYHGPGAILIGVTGKGYVPLWPHELGTHPYQDGYGDQVVEIEWGPRAVYCPPDGWFHQHMCTSRESARHVAIYGGRAAHSDRPASRDESPVFANTRTWEHKSVSQGGTLIEYDEEDPEIRRRFEEALKKEGVKCAMPPVTYRQ